MYDLNIDICIMRSGVTSFQAPGGRKLFAHPIRYLFFVPFVLQQIKSFLLINKNFFQLRLLNATFSLNL